MKYRVGTLVDFLNGLFKELKIERASLVASTAAAGLPLPSPCISGES
jgi:hypothetical protein